MSGQPLQETLGEVRRALEDIEGYRELATWKPFGAGDSQLWGLNFELSTTTPSELVPEQTSWYLLVTPHYPYAAAIIVPAKANGLARTFAHQTLNEVGTPTVPWRTGQICVTTPKHIADQLSQNYEPTTAIERATWQVERALLWVRAAAEGRLRRDGSWFELPHLGDLEGPTVAFQENDESFQSWGGEVLAGVANIRFHALHGRLPLYAVHELGLAKGKTFRRTEWHGSFADGKATKAIWLLVPELPVVEDWRLPLTWGELEATLQSRGIQLWEHIGPLLKYCRIHTPAERQNSKRTLLLLGFPVSYRYGESNSRIHWLAISLPLLSGGKHTANGFRPNEIGYARRDHSQVLVPAARLTWLPTENWDSADIHSRGALPMPLASMRVAILGAGAVGSHLAEALVRGGLKEMVLMDGERLEIGNLTRHTLGLESVGLNKARALAERVRTLSPRIEVEAIERNFVPGSKHVEPVMTSQLIIDCTGNREVSRGLADSTWPENTWFATLSVGHQARRTYLFTTCADRFPVDGFFEELEPWMEVERSQRPDEILYPAVGCYHPAFAASHLDIQLAAAVMSKQLVATLVGDQREARLRVSEVQTGPDGAVSIAPRELTHAHEVEQ